MVIIPDLVRIVPGTDCVNSELCNIALIWGCPKKDANTTVSVLPRLDQGGGALDSVGLTYPYVLVTRSLTIPSSQGCIAPTAPAPYNESFDSCVRTRSYKEE